MPSWREWNPLLICILYYPYVISFNGKARYNLQLPVGISKEEAEKAALENEMSQKWMEGKTVRKVIVVPGKIVNIVLG